jgi:S-adenosylmethionine/arginine decarboxylase-like enzyme
MVQSNMDTYGKELVLDLENCNAEKLTKEEVKTFCEVLAKELNIESSQYVAWESDSGSISAILFLDKSSISVHSVSSTKQCFVNVFATQDFEPTKITVFILKYLEGTIKECGWSTRG